METSPSRGQPEQAAEPQPPGGAGEADVLQHGGVRRDRLRHRAYRAGHELDLTPTEFRLLEAFLQQPGWPLTRRQLQEAARTKAGADERSIDQHVRKLRQKLGVPGLIETVSGVGFRFA